MGRHSKKLNKKYKFPVIYPKINVFRKYMMAFNEFITSLKQTCSNRRNFQGIT
jgi:hypothetical protein